MSDADWVIGQPSMNKWVRKGPQQLHVSIIRHAPGNPWVVVAVESGSVQKIKKAKSIVDAVNIVFDDHSHDVVGSSQKLSTAIKLADTYTGRWLRKRTSSKKCPCKAIEK